MPEPEATLFPADCVDANPNAAFIRVPRDSLRSGGVRRQAEILLQLPK
jgi:hypothetical protein